jgi:hypothetical protein
MYWKLICPLEGIVPETMVTPLADTVYLLSVHASLVPLPVYCAVAGWLPAGRVLTDSEVEVAELVVVVGSIEGPRLCKFGT